MASRSARLRACTSGAVDFRHGPQPAERRAHAAGSARLLHQAVEIFFHLAVALKIGVDVALRLGSAGARAPRQAKRAEPVNHAVVDGLRHAAVLVVLEPGRHAEYFLRRAGVNVLVARKSFDQQRVLGKMGKHAQLNLRIVGGDHLAAGIGDKSRADPQSELIANGNVLKVGIGGREPPGARHGLVEGRVQAAASRLNKFRQRIDVSGLQLGACAVFDDSARQVVLFGERFQHRGVGGILPALLQALAARQLELFKQNFAKLLGGIDVK